MSRLAIIPARGGSKRIPRKNIRPFLGRPIISYTIDAARESGLFDEVMVSTDDREIAQVARDSGAVVPFFRSETSSNDTATTLAVLEEVIGQYGEEGREFTAVCCLYPTSPFVTVDLLKKGYELLQAENFDCVFPVVRYGYPVQRSLRLDARQRMHLVQPEHLGTRSQDLEPTYHDAGMFYWFQPGPVIASGALWTGNTGCLELAELEAQDIDTEEDWRLAEFKYKWLRDG